MIEHSAECLANVKLFDLTVSSIEIHNDLFGRFHRAASNGDISRVESMLQEGVPVDCVDGHDQTALFQARLFQAVYFKRTNVIRLLLKKGVDVNYRDRGGDTPVHDAARWNSTDAIAMLIDHGALINITNNGGEKPIDLARRFESEAAVRMLEQL